MKLVDVCGWEGYDSWYDGRFGRSSQFCPHRLLRYVAQAPRVWIRSFHSHQIACQPSAGRIQAEIFMYRGLARTP